MTNLICFYFKHRFVVQEAIFARQSKKEGVESSPWARKRCIRQSALNAVRNVKFHSSLIQTGLFTAENAGQRNDPNADDIRLLTLIR
jgi:hypothetical protein